MTTKRKPRVLNGRIHELFGPDRMYCGRGRGVWGKWGNPLQIGDVITVKMAGYYQFDCSLVGATVTRELAIQGYEVHLDSLIERGVLDLSELTDKHLVCWCAPQPCHCDILLKRANPEMFAQAPLFDTSTFRQSELVEH